MKYMILMNATPDGLKEFAKMGPGDFKAHVAFMHDLNEGLRARGELVIAEGLTGPNEAKVVRAQDAGVPLAMDMREGGGADTEALDVENADEVAVFRLPVVVDYGTLPGDGTVVSTP